MVYRATFLRHAPESLRDALAALPDLEAQLCELLRSAREEWPGVPLSDEAFLRHVAERLGDDMDAEAAVASLRGGDLYIACGCGRGDARALEAFRARFTTAMRRAIRRHAQEQEVDDILQHVMAKLFVEEDRRPRIEMYTGRSKLSTWLHSVATRLTLNAKRGQHPSLLGTDQLPERAIDTADPHLEALRSRYRSEFKRAFQEAFSQLSIRQRNFLRHEFIDGLNIDRIGALYGVHRATVARWRVATREALLAKTCEVFERDHRVSEMEMKSIVRLLNSQLDVSLTRLLRESKPDAE